MPLKLSTASGGSVSIEPTNTASNYTLTVPAQTGTVAINGPAFSAYQSSNQSFSANTYTKVQFQTEAFDTANCFDSTTNYRFTPNVAGYYQISASVNMGGNPITWLEGSIFKNGSSYSPSFYRVSTGSIGAPSIPFNCLIYMNGTTDYLEIYAYTQTTNTASTSGTVFSAYLARAA